jgi:hypothetical protein
VNQYTNSKTQPHIKKVLETTLLKRSSKLMSHNPVSELSEVAELFKADTLDKGENHINNENVAEGGEGEGGEGEGGGWAGTVTTTTTGEGGEKKKREKWEGVCLPPPLPLPLLFPLSPLPLPPPLPLS